MGQKQTILIIDDERDFVDITKRRLEKKDYIVLTAYNGKEGLETLKKIKPDLIVLDINMPVMGGIEFYKNICDDKGVCRYPILILTAREELKGFFKDIEADSFLAKPFKIERLYEEIKAILEGKSRQKQQKQKASLTKGQKVFLVAKNSESRDKIVSALLDAGYLVGTIDTGKSALERIAKEPPDLLLIKLELSDISGDIVLDRLQLTLKEKGFLTVLYSHRKSSEIDGALKQRLGVNVAINNLVFSENPDEILKAVNASEKRRFDS